MSTDNKLDKVVSLAKRRGFIWPGSDLYGGLANTYDYGPYGTELKNNIQKLWWKKFVQEKENIFGIDSSILIRPEVWEASGHTSGFADVMVEDKVSHKRYRVDHLIEEYLEKEISKKRFNFIDLVTDKISGIKADEIDAMKRGKVDGFSIELLSEILNILEIKSPDGNEFTEPKRFNQLFETKIGIIAGEKNSAYLRGEIAQGLFLNYKNIRDTFHPQIPFGIAQVGKAFRNEITMGHFTHRTLEFDLMEFEFFFNPEKDDWNELFESWKSEVEAFAKSLGIQDENLRWRPHESFELSHYSKRTEDLEYKYPWGFKEWYAVAYRTDFDLRNHQEHSKKDLQYKDAEGGAFIPHVIEPTFGLSRSVTVLLMDAYREDTIEGRDRVYLNFSPNVAPVKVAVFPLQKDGKLLKTAKKLYDELKRSIDGLVEFDTTGSIGKRYRRQDEIGTPWCVTIDFESLDDKKATIRDRDTLEQVRIPISEIPAYIDDRLQ